MKFLTATKDNHGYHYTVALDEAQPATGANVKMFNYGPIPAEYHTGRLVADPQGRTIDDPNGAMIPDPAGGTMQDPSGKTQNVRDPETDELITVAVLVPASIPKQVQLMVPEVIQETEAQYRARIETEIAQTANALKAGPIVAALTDLGLAGVVR